MQYQTGTVSVTNGSAIVTGSGTLWLTYASIGDLFKVKGEDAIYTIASVDTDTQITLSANYAGTTDTGLQYQIARDFTPNLNLYEVWAGDKDWPYHLTVSTLRKLDSLLGILETGSSTTTDAVKTTILDRTLDEGYVYLIRAKVTAKEGDTNRAAYVREALVYRASGGSATLQGSVNAPLTIESDSDWDCTIEVSGNDVQLNITGKAATTINWTASWEIMER